MEWTTEKTAGVCGTINALVCLQKSIETDRNRVAWRMVLEGGGRGGGDCRCDQRVVNKEGVA